MSKTIVTHKHPDLDAIMSSWLLVRFDQSRYGDAEIAFIDAGKTYKDFPVDSDPDITHVDTGHGKYDHHQPGAYGTCASRLVWESLVSEGLILPTDKPLISMITFANDIDTFEDCYWPESTEARFAFTLPEIIPALHRLQIHDDEAVLRMVFVQLDGVYQRLKDREEARVAVEMGEKFSCKWGKAVVCITGADDVSKYAQKQGYDIIIIRDPKKMRTAIKTAPKVELSLALLYDKITKIDDPKKWFYHNSGHMLMNGSSKGVDNPTELPLAQIVDLIKMI